jgi:FecR protein
MKETRRLLNSLVACGLALAMVSTLAAQTVNQGAAKVVRLKGSARYSTGNNVWQPLKVGDVVKPGTVIQTAAKSSVDFVLGDGSAPVARPVAGEMLAYQPTAEQNLVRLWENTLLSVDKMTVTETGADVVTETQLDLKAGHIFGTVKKMSAASKYEVKIPNGVAGIRGTTYDISAEGVIKVLAGSVVLAYVGPDGTVVTQVIMGSQQFDARTGVLSQISSADKTTLQGVVRQLPIPVPASATSRIIDKPPFVSAH